MNTMAGRAATGQRPDRDTEGCEDVPSRLCPPFPPVKSTVTPVRSDAFEGKGHAIHTGTPLVVEPANKATRSYPSRPLAQREGTKDVNPGADRLPPLGHSPAAFRLTPRPGLASLAPRLVRSHRTVRGRAVDRLRNIETKGQGSNDGD